MNDDYAHLFAPGEHTGAYHPGACHSGACHPDTYHPDTYHPGIHHDGLGGGRHRGPGDTRHPDFPVDPLDSAWDPVEELTHLLQDAVSADRSGELATRIPASRSRSVISNQRGMSCTRSSAPSAGSYNRHMNCGMTHS